MLLVLQLALAADPSAAWKSLYEGRLVQIADGTPVTAVRLYDTILEDLGVRAPSAVHYWRGRALLAAGQLPQATASLELAVGDPALRLEALALIEEAELRQRVITRLPARFTFDGDVFPGVRSGGGAGRGDAGPTTEDGRRVYAWSTTIRPGEPDRVSLRLGDVAGVTAVRFAARSRGVPAVLKLVAVDPWGGTWTSTEVVVDDDDWYDVELRVADFLPPERVAGPARISRVVELRLEDVTGERSEVRGAHTLLLDDLEIDG
jgi:hypothetical protein